MIRITVATMLTLALVHPVSALEQAVPVSPGSTEAVTLEAALCPTFSWAPVRGAALHELVVYRVAVDNAQETTLIPVLETSVLGEASAWTPPLQQCLEPGEVYAWAVRSIGENGHVAEWSEIRLFQLDRGPSLREVKQALDILRRFSESRSRKDSTRGNPSTSTRKEVEHSQPTKGEAHEAATSEVAALTKGSDPYDPEIETLTILADTVGFRSRPGSNGVTFGVHGVSASSQAGSAGLVGESTATTGDVRGVVAETGSAAGTAGLFVNTAGGDLLRGVSGASDVFTVDGLGEITGSALDVGDTRVVSGTFDLGPSASDDLTASDVETLTSGGNASTLHLHDDSYRTETELASTSVGLGASLIGVADTGNHFASTTVEGALAELAGSGGGGTASDLECSSCVEESELAFATATDAELSAHATSGDHDGRYVNSSGDTMTGTLNFGSTLRIRQVTGEGIIESLNGNDLRIDSVAELNIDTINDFRIDSDQAIRLNTGSFVTMNTESGVFVDGTMEHSSDRERKRLLGPVKTDRLLEDVVGLPLHLWQWKAGETEALHLGPTAQDFAAVFGLGSDDRYIATVDADGVALAAIQGLHRLVKEGHTELQSLRKENRVLRERLLRMERFLSRMCRTPNSYEIGGNLNLASFLQGSEALGDDESSVNLCSIP